MDSTYSKGTPLWSNVTRVIRSTGMPLFSSNALAACLSAASARMLCSARLRSQPYSLLSSFQLYLLFFQYHILCDGIMQQFQQILLLQ